MKIILSKKQWQKMGKKAGWTKKATFEGEVELAKSLNAYSGQLMSAVEAMAVVEITDDESNRRLVEVLEQCLIKVEIDLLQLKQKLKSMYGLKV